MDFYRGRLAHGIARERCRAGGRQYTFSFGREEKREFGET
jgi:hypothetical protein